MTTLKSLLERLDLARYHDAFVEEGFDTWETLMDITESDLETLGVKLGHRRKLQRAIVEASKDRTPLSQLLQSGPRDESAGREEPKKAQPPQLQQQTSNGSQDLDTASRASGPPQRSKRKYRRHPKADEHAPERPPSAYVIFSNQIRDQLKGQELSFTEIAKLVGERWQELQQHEKEPCEREAQALKDTYYSQLRQYKRTPQYRQYQEYLAEFKAKHSGDASQQQQQQGPEQKKPKLRQEVSSISRIYDDSVVDGDEGADGTDGVDGADGDDGMDGVDSTYNNQQPSSPDKARPSPTHSPSNLEHYRLFPILRAPPESATSSSYSTWRSNQQNHPTASLHRYTTKSTLSSDQDSRSLTSSRPAPSTASTISPTAAPTNTSAPGLVSAGSPLRSTLQPGANKPAPISNTTLPPINSLASIATRNSSDTPLLNWPLHTTLPLLDPRAMSQRSTPDAHYSSPRMHQVTQPGGPSLRSPPWPSVQDSTETNSKNKASLSTLLRATEHVERDDNNRATGSTHKR
ncbi:hypothetical protein E4T52_10027 [Aureobasidium sp. EXF-3400]|nr:hypothetical protein E4T51_09071 [Aureobasidium sp. EXF-12344]KAI4775038.1 hypothetical protein E4T52_10027 [Aureobasidium sp. EXF-3400]